jgi:hypothetical protein
MKWMLFVLVLGRRLQSCMTCNIWWSLRGAKVRLSEEDLRALLDLMRHR